MDHFYFESDDNNVEDMRQYRPGGFHPVRIGDLYGPTSRYRVLYKLGHGGYGTVWLAHDLEGPRFSFRRLENPYRRTRHEVRALVHLSSDDSPAHPGREHVVQLLDHFQIHGPNGTHDVVVTEVLCPLLSMKGLPIFERMKRAFCQQIILGLAYLHSRGVAHGDLHIGNLACTLPGFDDQTLDAVLCHFYNPVCTIVLTRDVADQTDSLPPYVVASISVLDFMIKEVKGYSEDSLPLLRIIDFSSAYRKTNVRPMYYSVPAVWPPEVYFAKVALKEPDPEWDERGDIWALACTVSELIINRPLFYEWNSAAYLLSVARTSGCLPATWKAYCSSAIDANPDKRDIPEIVEKRWASYRREMPDVCIDDEDVEKLVRLLRSMLVVNPAERPTAQELLYSPWMVTKTQRLSN
ncbi:kinase-like domain-containing protein [Mucidula mucida]|nr:kinase-like domain-containing protein [Mucidula mucida]